MKKFIVLLAVLALFAGTAFAGSLSDLQTAELAAETTGRSIVSGTSVLMNIWRTDGDLDCQVGVSAVSVLCLYESGAILTDARLGTGATAVYGIDTTSATGNTVGEVVDIINNDSDGIWKASVGDDAYRGLSSGSLLQTTAISSPGIDEANAVKIYLSPDDAEFITCGVKAQDNAVSRIKSFTHKFSGTGNVITRIYDNDTAIYRMDVGNTQYNLGTVSGNGASPLTVNFANLTAGKGIAGGRGKTLVVRVDRTTGGTDASTPEKLGGNQISITYDKVVK